MKYRCIKTMYLEKYDGDGFLMEGRYMTIPEGSIWEVCEEVYNFIAGTDCVHLERVWKSKKAKSHPWLEITKEHLAVHFEPIEQIGE